jgi:carbonic anhydrase
MVSTLFGTKKLIWRIVMKRSVFLLVIGFQSMVFSMTAFGAMTPNNALKTLLDGNKRYVENSSVHPNRSEERRREIKQIQKPFAVILSCSDSRLASEIIFDQGLGDLFVVRVAGNVLGDIELESVEYSTLFLNSSLIMVMGHQNCGAVEAVLDGNSQAIPSIAQYIEPAIELSKTQKGNRLENAIKDNVDNVVQQLQTHPSFQKLIAKKKLAVVGAYYNFQSGEVEMLPNKPMTKRSR